jgi:hypothetical protein
MGPTSGPGIVQDKVASIHRQPEGQLRAFNLKPARQLVQAPIGPLLFPAATAFHRLLPRHSPPGCSHG